MARSPAEARSARVTPDRFDTRDVVTDLKRKSVRAGSAAIVSQSGVILVSLAAQMVLARLLGPDEFGVVGMGFAVMTALSVARDAGLPTATLAAGRLDQRMASTLFWLNLAFTALFTTIIAGCGPIVARAFDDVRLVTLMPVFAVAYFLNGLTAQHEALLGRQMKFGAIGIVTVVSLAMGITVSIMLAVHGWGYWALAAQYPVTACARTIWVLALARWTPGRPNDLREVRDLIRYGIHVTGNRVISHFGRHLDRWLVGIADSTQAVGLYMLADRWSDLTVKSVYPRLMNVTVAGLSRIRDDVPRFRAYFRRAAGPLLGVVLPGLAFLFVEADAIMRVLLGPDPAWRPVANLFRILLFAALGTSVTHLTKWLYLAEAETRRQLSAGLLFSGITILCVVSGMAWGVWGVAVAYAGASFFSAPFAVWFCLRGSRVRWSDFRSILTRPTITVAVAATFWTMARPAFPEETVLRISLAAAVFAVSTAACWLLPPSGRQEISDAWLAFHGAEQAKH